MNEAYYANASRDSLIRENLELHRRVLLLEEDNPTYFIHTRETPLAHSEQPTSEGISDQRLQEQERLLKAFHTMGQVILSSLSIDEILDRLARQIVQAGIFRSLMVALVDEKAQRVKVECNFVCLSGYPEHPTLTPGQSITTIPSVTTHPEDRNVVSDQKIIGRSYALTDDNITALVARTGHIEVVDEWDNRFDAGAGSPVHRLGNTAYFLPVKKGDRVLAVLATGSRIEDKAETLHRIETMQPLLDLVAIALENARLYKAQQASNAQLSQLNEQLNIRVRDRTEALNAAQQVLGQQDIQGDLIGKSPCLLALQQNLAHVASTGLTTLIVGETGTGKGLAAHTLHNMSNRASGPFIPVHCGAIPTNLFESELFGHEKGAFTGAIQRKLGRIELAQGGSLFLDEIGEMPLDAQVKLLHLLEERIFGRVGGIQTLYADVRIIAATNRDLAKMVREGSFRQDLYFRLEEFIVCCPPLRERQQDIPLLAQYFIERMSMHIGKTVRHIAPDVLTHLQEYHWPGNVRELEHVIRRAVVMCTGETIQLSDISLDFGHAQVDCDPKLVTLDEHERCYILRVLEKTNHVVKGPYGAAKILGLPSSTLRSRMKKLGVI